MAPPVETREVFSAGRAEDARAGVTVAVSLYNYEEFIGECLDSIYAQTYEAIDLIVLDDASPRDRSLEAAAEWMKKKRERFRRCLLLRHTENQGLAQARNTAFAHAACDNVLVMDADNVVFPTAVARLQAALCSSDAAAAYSQLKFFGDEEGLGLADFWSKDKLAKGNYIDAMALVRRTAWATVGGVSHLEGGWEDYDFWCKFVDHGLEALYVPQILCGYRVHGSSMLRTETNLATERLKNRMVMRHPWLDL